MFVTISVLLDDLEVVEEKVYNDSFGPVSVNGYLAHRQIPELHHGFTPVRVVVIRKGSPDIHVVEFTGCHYGLHVKPDDAERHEWSSGILPSSSGIYTMMYDYQPSVKFPEVRQMTEQESLFHDYALTLANDYFNDRFHLAEGQD